MKRRHQIWILILFLWLAFVLRAWGLGDASLWYDEAFSVYIARAELHTAWNLLIQDFHPPLYYALLRLSIPLFGSSEFGVRFLSLLTSLPLIPLTWVLGRQLFRRNPRLPLVATLLVAVAPFYVWYAREARMYSLTTTLGLAATVSLLRALDRRSPGWYAAFVGCALAAVYTHYSALYLILGLGLYWLTQVLELRSGFWPHRRQALAGALAFGVVALGIGVSIPHLLGFAQSAQGFWPGRLDLGRALGESAHHLLASPSAAAPLSTVLVGLWGVMAGLGLIAWAGTARGRRALGLTLCSLVIPALVNFALLANRPKFEPRHLMVLSPPLWLLCAGATFGAPRRLAVLRRALAWSCGGILVVGLAYTDGVILTHPARDDWRAAVRYVKSAIAPDEALILVSGHAFPALWYYDAPAWVALPDDVLLDVTHTLNYPVVGRLNQALSDKGGAWLLEWQSEVIDPTGIVLALLEQAGAEQSNSPSFTGVGVRHFRFERGVHFPPRPEVQWRWEKPILPHLTFIGATPRPDPPLPADVPLQLQTFWQAKAPLSFGYRASLRLQDSQNIEYARADYDLAGPRYSTNLWQVDVPVMGHYTVTLPLGTPPGIYTPTLTIYRVEETFDTLQLGPVTITRPLSIPSRSALGLDSIPTSLSSSPTPGAAEVTLAGIGFDQQRASPCQQWYLSLAWETVSRPTQDYSLRLSAGSDQTETKLTPDYATSHWQPGDLWRTRHRIPINCRALDGTVPVTGQLLGADGQPVGEPILLGEILIVAGRRFTLPTDLSAVLDVRMAGIGTLAGYRLEKAQYHPGENLKVTLYWHVDHETDQNYSVFVHLESDIVRAQHDSWPMEGRKPTSTWAVEEVVADQHIVPIGADVPPGTYRLVVGMYDPAKLENVPAFGPDGQPISGGRVVLQQITVKAP